MIRYTLLTAFVLVLVVYTWRDWFKGLCGLILFMAVYGHPDMPRELFGVPGLNPFNILLLNISLAWLSHRKQEKLSWDMPTHVNLLLLLYLVVVLVSTFRMLADPRNLVASRSELINEHLFNCLKWVVPSLLMFDGCRSRERFGWGMLGVLVTYVLLAVVCARNVSPTLSVSELERKSGKVLEKQTGYDRVDLSTMLAGASWALFAAKEMFRRPKHRLALVGASVLVFYGQLLTAGRAGYASFVVVGVVLCALRWRRYLLVAPVAALVVAVAFPSVIDRLTEGFDTARSMSGETTTIDETAILAGRNLIWPYVIDKIKENPIVGYGRQAQIRIGLSYFAKVKFHDTFGHPHNAYLELLLDTGLLGFLPVMTYFMVVLFHSLILFRDSRSPIFIAAGGAGIAMTLSWLGGSVGAQSFYPRESSVGMFCAMMLVFRVSVERSRVLARERAAQRAARKSVGAAPSEPAVKPASKPLGAYARRRRPRPRWDAELFTEATTKLDGQLWAKPA